MADPESRRRGKDNQPHERIMDRRRVRPFNEGEREYLTASNLRSVATPGSNLGSEMDRDRDRFTLTDPSTNERVLEATSVYNEIAFPADQREFFLRGSAGKTLREQEEMLAQGNERLRMAGIASLRWEIPSLPDAVEVVRDSMGRDLFFGDTLNRQIRTTTVLSGYKALLSAVVGRGGKNRLGLPTIAILAWEANGSSRSLAAVPILVPTSRPGEGFGEIRG